MKSLARPAVLAFLVTFATQAFAQFPSKPVRIIFPYATAGGGGLDAIVRLLAQEVSVSIKQPVMVEYKPGASTTIGAAATVNSPPDGHTLFLNAQSFLITAQLMSKLPYDPKKDLTPVTSLVSNPHVLVVGPRSPHKTAQEFFEAAHKKGSAMSYASFGNASSGHLGFEGLKKTMGFEMTHIPYKGSEGMNDVMAGRVDTMFADLPSSLPQAAGGRLLQLAVASAQRDPLAPDVPTIAEVTGKPFVSRSWFGLLVRADTPREIVMTLNREFIGAMAKPHVAERIRSYGFQAMPSSPEAFTQFMAAESLRISEAIKFSGAKME
jgi:tripartite-type tricarboxylate transporter receptor subunit TctC